MLKPLTGLSGALALLALLSACAGPALQPLSRQLAAQTVQTASASRNSLEARFSQADAVPEALLASLTSQAQAYADDLSRRRELDYFRVHPQPVGLRLSIGSDSAWLLSFVGTSKDRNDLNLELRALVGKQLGLNLNYSGPVTLSRTAVASRPEAVQRQAVLTNSAFDFELITGLPGQGVTERYGDYLEGLTKYLSYRYQAKPIEFDDGPLIYAIHHQGTLQGFAFMNQRNRLILGERKYADVQNVAIVSTDRRLLGSYTVVGFNPKTGGAAQSPVYHVENHAEFGSLVQLGEL